MNIEDKLVRVEWVDSSTASSWTLMEDFKEEQHNPIKIVSYGIIVKETDNYLVIAQNYGTNPPQICNTTAIPKGCIIKQKIIKSEDKMEEKKTLGEERQEAICKECVDYNTSKCPYVILGLRCQNLSNQMDGWELGYKDAIEKACEWLNNFYNEDTHSYLVKEDIEDFRKAMEEQQ